MKANEYKEVFGRIFTLAEPVSWSVGISNMLAWLLWNTRHILGISKTEYWKLAVKWSHDETIRNSDLDEKQKYIEDKLEEEGKKSERLSRYDLFDFSLAKPYEVLRRAKYFSEDYLNREFDIFWALVSDAYLDDYYGQFTALNGGGRWFTHGNSGLFQYSTGIGIGNDKMQMDSLSYNPDESILIACELKLGGNKNNDQMLKYAWMYGLLKKREFISLDTRFLLLFIGDEPEKSRWDEMLEDEKNYCRSKNKIKLLCPDVLEEAKKAEYATTTWRDLMGFNDKYMSKLDVSSQQVEHKLLWGFNETLSEKDCVACRPVEE